MFYVKRRHSNLLTNLLCRLILSVTEAVFSCISCFLELLHRANKVLLRCVSDCITSVDMLLATKFGRACTLKISFNHCKNLSVTTLYYLKKRDLSDCSSEKIKYKSITMPATASKLISFVNATPTPFHLVKEAEKLLSAAGFSRLDERDLWAVNKMIVPGGKYFYHRNLSTIVAFSVGKLYKPGGEFKVVGAHTDSPVLKVKPVSTKTAHGYIQVGVECYGGGLWHTWFDRDLTLAGCAVVEENGEFVRKLLHIKRPILRVPSLCIHLQTADERASFAPNKETHLQPILSLVEKDLNSTGDGDKFNAENVDKRHCSQLLSLLCEELSCEPQQIKDLELTLCDTQPGSVWGAKNEFLSSPRMDNQVHCYTSLSALLDHSNDEECLNNDTGVSMVVCFDHEEIGSDSAQGAGSPVMSEAISRVLGCFDTSDEMLKVTIRNSFLVSADVAHAIHPNYDHKHERNHQPVLNKGTVIKSNQNQRYATNAETGFILRELARKAGAPIQEFVVRNDCPCGSTIGPIIASKIGIRTVDLGVPSLSMHSIRETIGCQDVTTNAKLFTTFFKEFGKLDKICKF